MIDAWRAGRIDEAGRLGRRVQRLADVVFAKPVGDYRVRLKECLVAARRARGRARPPATARHRRRRARRAVGGPGRSRPARAFARMKFGVFLPSYIIPGRERTPSRRRPPVRAQRRGAGLRLAVDHRPHRHRPSLLLGRLAGLADDAVARRRRDRAGASSARRSSSCRRASPPCWPRRSPPSTTSRATATSTASAPAGTAPSSKRAVCTSPSAAARTDEVLDATMALFRGPDVDFHGTLLRARRRDRRAASRPAPTRVGGGRQPARARGVAGAAGDAPQRPAADRAPPTAGSPARRARPT